MADLPKEIWASVTQLTENFGGAFWRPRPFPAGKHHAEGVPYTRSDIADEHKQQRDRLLAACKLVDPLLKKSNSTPGIYEELREIRAAIAECEARTENDIPRTLVPGAPHPEKKRRGIRGLEMRWRPWSG